MSRSLWVILTIILTVICNNHLLARDYNSEALNIKNSVDVNAHFSSASAANSIESYQGASAVETSYYSGGDMDSDSRNVANDSVPAQIMGDVIYNSPDYTINPNEDWLQNANNVTKDPESVLSLISSNYDDCSKSQKSCIFYQGISQEMCQASRVVEIDTYHKYQCFKDKYSYEIDCDNSLDLSCAKSNYTLPPITKNTFPTISFSGITLRLAAGWRGGNCSGYNYEFKFKITDPSVVESFILRQTTFDDRILVYVNNKLVYHPVTSGCERNRVFRYSPNLNLKSRLIAGENSIKIKLIVGGMGVLDSRFELKYKKCTSYSSNQWVKTCDDKIFDEDECIQTENVCIEGAASRSIGQGVSEYRSCWKYGVKEQCIPSDYVNNCEQLEELSGCTQNGSECIEEADGQCLNYQNDYKCASDEVAIIENKLIYEGFFQDVLNDYIDYSNCDHLDKSSYCSLTDETCANSGRKDIDGLIINKSCWDYDRTYSCSNESPDLSNCSGLENTCSFDSQECIEKNSDDICVEYKRNYLCNDVGGQDADIAICGSQVYCENGNCEDISYEKDTNFAKAVANLAMLEEAADDFDESDSSTFTGQANQCGKDLINYSDCCKSSGWGEAIGAACSSDDQDLQLKRSEKLCVYVGEYCSDEEDLTGICTKEKQSYCCFNSKIARIIHEQGRPQLGISWGSPESPNCAGFPITKLDDIDFSAINFGELSAEITGNAQGNIVGDADLKSIIGAKVQAHYEKSVEGDDN